MRVPSEQVSAGSSEGYSFVLAAFLTLTLCASLIGPSKVVAVGAVTFSSGVLFYPATYVLGDILTEVFGYRLARRAILLAGGALITCVLLSTLVLALPPAPSWDQQASYEQVFGTTWRVVTGSILAFVTGELLNAQLLLKIKERTGGRLLWVRTLGSSIIAQAVDGLAFYPIAFAGIWPNDILVRVMITNYFLKLSWEALATPVTYACVGVLRRKSGRSIE